MKQITRKKKKWTIQPEVRGDFYFGDYPKAIIQVLRNRGVISNEFTNGTNVTNIEDFLNPDYETGLHDPFLLKDMDKAVDRILKAVGDKEKICIYGDYDVDGLTATALLADLFTKLGADYMTYIPSRHDEGYGLNIDAIDEIKKNGVNLMITVDCGVRSFEDVEHINSSGMDVIITDHHEISLQFAASSSQKKDLKKTGQRQAVNGKQDLPDATAVINPKRSDCDYPFMDLAGVGVAFKLACAVSAKGETLGKFNPGWEKWMLDLVALGTVCDIVSLTDENRVLVKFGLKVLEKTKRDGLKALLESAAVDPQNIGSHNLGFHLGPRLNAAGRLESAKMSLELLTTDDSERAEDIALKLSKLNKERQDMTNKILDEARKEIENIGDDQNIYLIKNKNWPSGVVGIVASRLVDDCGKPILLMEEGADESKGSARSISNFSIIEALEGASEHLVKYGGHKKAAGLTVKNEHFVLLNNKLVEIAGEKIREEDLIPEIKIDARLNIADIDDTLNNYLKKMEPYGYGNTKPIFMLKNVTVENATLVGAEKNHLKLKVEDGGKSMAGIYFRYGTELEYKESDKIDVVFTVTENEWMGRVNLEMRVMDIKRSESS